MTKEFNLEDLKQCFPADDIEWRIGQSGVAGSGPWAKAFAYVSNRAIQNRLDEICGPENWKNEQKVVSFPVRTVIKGEENVTTISGFICGISIRINGEWITKFDGASLTDFEAFKGGLSDSMKRAGYQWGIGRYLYKLPESWVKFTGDRHDNYIKIKGEAYYWQSPALPAWALPGGKSNDPAGNVQTQAPGQATDKAPLPDTTQASNQAPASPSKQLPVATQAPPPEQPAQAPATAQAPPPPPDNTIPLPTTITREQKQTIMEWMKANKHSLDAVQKLSIKRYEGRTVAQLSYEDGIDFAKYVMTTTKAA